MRVFFCEFINVLNIKKVLDDVNSYRVLKFCGCVGSLNFEMFLFKFFIFREDNV